MAYGLKAHGLSSIMVTKNKHPHTHTHIQLLSVSPKTLTRRIKRKITLQAIAKLFALHANAVKQVKRISG